MTRSEQIYDAVVVGSGATGGVAAKRLAERGLRVLVLEAGKHPEELGGYRDPVRSTARKIARHVLSRRQPIQSLHTAYWTTNPNFFVDDLDNPYGTPKDKPFRWIRGRVAGGRTLTWDGVTPRLSDFELTAATRDGVGVDWPIHHEDLAPYYAQLERYFGILGHRDGLPQLPDGCFVGAGALTASEQVFRERLAREMPERSVIVSRGLGAGRRPGRGEAHSKLSNLTTTLQDALRTGRVQMRTDAVASRVLLGRGAARAAGVEYVDAASGIFHFARSQLVFLCASTLESVRILLNSATPDRPGGLGSDSGALGRYVMDHVASNLYFQLPDVPSDGARRPLRGGDALMIPRFTNLGRQDASHLRGYGMWGGIDRIPLPGVVRRAPGEAFGWLSTRGEVLPSHDNHARLDDALADRWGIPCLRISCEWKENDLALARAARKAAIEIIECVGGEVAPLSSWLLTPLVGEQVRRIEREWRISTPGLVVHELGGARMGADPRGAVLDPSCALWDVPNVYVTDGACWPSSGWQNPTLTEMAVTLRAVDRAIDTHR
jgi:choline dehydrogenase-like flavoprotein